MTTPRLTDEEVRRRRLEARLLWEAGVTPSEMARAWGMSRERVRQILVKAGVVEQRRVGWVTRPPGTRVLRAAAGAVRTERADLRARWRRRLLVWLVRDFAAEHNGVGPTLRQLAALLGIVGPAFCQRLYAYLDPRRGTERVRLAVLHAGLFRAAGAARPPHRGRYS